MISVPNQLVGASLGQPVTLECHSEAYPQSINYWTHKEDQIIAPGAKYQTSLLQTEYRVAMRLTISHVEMGDFGAYRCVAKNSLGDTDGVIKLYRKYRDWEAPLGVSGCCPSGSGSFVPVLIIMFPVGASGGVRGSLFDIRWGR